MTVRGRRGTLYIEAAAFSEKGAGREREREKEMQKISEYDAFGPWVYEITEEHPLPPLFEPYFPTDEPFEMAFKIPREIERRKATPDMDLYDYVVAAFSDRILILTRQDKAVEETWVSYEGIQSVRLYRRMLYGVCTLYLRQSRVEIPFNVVSVDILMRFIRLVRAKLLADAPAYDIPQSLPDSALGEVLFVNLLRDLRDAGEQFALGAVQKDIVVRDQKQSFVQTAIQVFRPKRLMSAMHLINGRELLVIRRGSGGQKARDSEYSYDYTYIPRRNIREISLHADEQLAGVTVCSVWLTHHRFDWQFGADNEAAVEFYRELQN